MWCRKACPYRLQPALFRATRNAQRKDRTKVSHLCGAILGVRARFRDKPAQWNASDDTHTRRCMARGWGPLPFRIRPLSRRCDTAVIGKNPFNTARRALIVRAAIHRGAVYYYASLPSAALRGRGCGHCDAKPIAINRRKPQHCGGMSVALRSTRKTRSSSVFCHAYVDDRDHATRTRGGSL